MLSMPHLILIIRTMSQNICWLLNFLYRFVDAVNYASTIPNVVHHVWSYMMMVRDSHISIGRPVDICIPIGQFTNILGAYYAKVSDVYTLYHWCEVSFYKTFFLHFVNILQIYSRPWVCYRKSGQTLNCFQIWKQWVCLF